MPDQNIESSEKYISKGFTLTTQNELSLSLSLSIYLLIALIQNDNASLSTT